MMNIIRQLGKRREQKKGKSARVSVINHGGSKVTSQNGGERESCDLLGSQGLYLHNQQHRDAMGSGRKVRGGRRVPGTSDRNRAGILDGHRNQQIKRSQFSRGQLLLSMDPI